MGSAARKRTSGFTLIELLVVIAIIAILAAILFPVFAKAKRQANLTNCGSQMKQIAMAMLAYSGDYSGRMPRIGTYNPSTGIGTIRSEDSVTCRYNLMVQDLRPYVKNDGIYRCPGAVIKAPKNTSTNPQDWDDFLLYMPQNEWVRKEVSYRFNDAMIETGAPGGPRMKLLSQCALPKKFYLIQDRHSDHHKASNDEPMVRWTMVTVMTDGHLDSYVQPYDKVWIGLSGVRKYAHWDFPFCHPSDPGDSVY